MKPILKVSDGEARICLKKEAEELGSAPYLEYSKEKGTYIQSLMKRSVIQKNNFVFFGIGFMKFIQK